jgi:site-specific recombinase XerD
MLNRLFKYSDVLQRIRSNLLADTIEDLAAYLHHRGNRPETIQSYIRAVVHFGYWLEHEKIPHHRLNDEILSLFLREHVPKCRCRIPRNNSPAFMQAALGHLKTVLEKQGRFQAQAERPKLPVDLILEAFERHLRTTRGVTDETCALYLRRVREFLEATYGRRKINAKRLTPQLLMRYVAQQSARYAPKAAKSLIVSPIRSFLRFMALQGLCDTSLVCAVPTIPQRRLSSLPRCVNLKEVAALLGAFDLSDGSGLRNHAMALCLVRLGLRAGEVAKLRIDDIDWRAGTIRMQRGKSRRTRVLPIPKDVGQAIVAYLKKGRPSTVNRCVFVRHFPPVGLSISGSAVRSTIRRAFTRAGVDPPSATHMVQAGASIKEVADVLGHRSIDTTGIYTKTDLPTLSAVALPWPEVTS